MKPLHVGTFWGKIYVIFGQTCVKFSGRSAASPQLEAVPYDYDNTQHTPWSLKFACASQRSYTFSRK